MEKEQKITKAELARRKREEKLAAERERIEALCEFEKEYDYCRYICGIDEAGRGPACWSGGSRRGDTAEGQPAFYISMIPRN